MEELRETQQEENFTKVQRLLGILLRINNAIRTGGLSERKQVEENDGNN